MTPAEPPFPTPDHTDARRRSGVGTLAVMATAALTLSACGVGGEPVDAGVAAGSATSVADVDITDCPEWAVDVLTSSPTENDVDGDGWREHFLNRASLLEAAADRLPTADAAVIDDYAVAVRDFGNDPMSPGASRQMGEAAANAADVAARSC